MKNTIQLALITSVITLIGTFSAQAATVEGIIKGAQCHLQGNQCVESKNDPRLILENDFILVNGSDYYFLPNLPRDIKLNVYNQKVSIEGTVLANKIDVDRVVRKYGSKEDTVWDEQEIFDELYEG